MSERAGGPLRGRRAGRADHARPSRAGNGITAQLIAELVACVERADLDPAVHVMLLSGNGPGFCGGYDLVESAEGIGAADGCRRRARTPPRGRSGSPIEPAMIAANHDPRGTWDPMVDYAMMSRNASGFMRLFHCGKPVVCRCTASAWRAAPTWPSARTCS